MCYFLVSFWVYQFLWLLWLKLCFPNRELGSPGAVTDSICRTVNSTLKGRPMEHWRTKRMHLHHSRLEFLPCLFSPLKHWGYPLKGKKLSPDPLESIWEGLGMWQILIIQGYIVQGKRVRNITSTILLALGLCLHSSKIKQIVLVWVLPDPMSASISFCGRQPQEPPTEIWESEMENGRQRTYIVHYHISQHFGATRAQFYCGALRDGVQHARELGHSSTSAPSIISQLLLQGHLTHCHFWLSPCSRPTMVHWPRGKSPRQS